MKNRLRYLPKILFFAIVVKPIVLFLLGLNVRGRQYLPSKGGAIIAANHNSHLDTLVLMSLYPLSEIHRIRPVAAADYFFKNRYLSWFSKNCIGIIALKREGFQRPEQLFAECHQALDNDEILIIFPEGSRGKPEQIGKIKKGLYCLYQQRQEKTDTATPIIPVILRGLGNALPKGEALFVPFNCDVIIGNPLPIANDSTTFLANLQDNYQQLSVQCLTK